MTGTGVLDILTTEILTYDPEDATATIYPAKITLTDTVSNHTIESEFEITLKNKCAENVLSLSDDLTDITYIMNSGNSAEI